MIDKLLLNNQILANKKKVQQSKVNIVNKLVQKLRKLKSLNEKRPEDKKILTKIRKTTEILACVKKTNKIEIVKKALLNDKNSLHIITNGRSTPEEICEALYFSNKNIIAIVVHLKTLLNLNDTNPGWKEQIQELSKKKRKSLRTEAKQERRQQRKERNELNKKRNEWLEQNVTKEAFIENNEIESNADSNKQQWSVKEIKNEEISKHSKEKVKKAESKPSKTIVVKPIKRKEIEIHSSDNEVTPSVKAVDPFFITQSGDNYLSTAVIDRVQPEPPNDGLVRKERRAQGGNRRVRQPNRSTWNNTFTPNINERVFKKKPTDSSQNSEKLHPSWAAKQKQKGIHEFKGSKITFGDNSVDATTSNSVKKDNNDLHPSWAAKQKIKPVIAEFKGTKVVFDDD